MNRNAENEEDLGQTMRINMKQNSNHTLQNKGISFELKPNTITKHDYKILVNFID